MKHNNDISLGRTYNTLGCCDYKIFVLISCQFMDVLLNKSYCIFPTLIVIVMIVIILVQEYFKTFLC